MRQRTPIDDTAAEVARGSAARLEAAKESPAVVKITETIGTLRQAEIDLSGQYLTLLAELPDHRQAAGEGVLDTVLSRDNESDDTVPGSDSLANVNAEGEVLIAGIDAARNRRREALGDRSGAIAQALRKGELETVKAEATEHGRKVRKALETLEKLEGARYISAGHSMTGQGVHIDDYTGMIPRSVIIGAQVSALEGEVAQAQAVRIRDAGTLTGRSRDAIIQAVLDVPVDMIGPSIPDLIVWLDAAEPEVLDRLKRLQGGLSDGGVDLFYYLIFDGGKIDPARSRIIIPAADHAEARALNVRPLDPVAR